MSGGIRGDGTRGGAPRGGRSIDALTEHLQRQATEFLRSLRLHRESAGAGSGGEESADAARALRLAAHRIGSALHTFRPLLDPEWSDTLRTELGWLAGILGREHASAARLERLLAALHRLSGAEAATSVPHALRGGTGTVRTMGEVLREPLVATTPGGTDPGLAALHAATPARAEPGTAAATRLGSPGLPSGPPAPPPSGTLTVGAAKAGALLERQLTLARTRAHSTALQALGSSRFHAVADRVAVLASEVPLAPGAASADLKPYAAETEARLAEAVAALPLQRAGRPYNADALMHGLAAEPAPQSQDAPWHQVRLLLRLHRYARDVLHGGYGDAGTSPAFRGAPTDHDGSRDAEQPRHADAADRGLAEAGVALDRHHEAAEAAAAAAAAARTPRIAPATAYALGVLHADQRQEVEAARFAFQDVWLHEVVDQG